MDIKLYQQAKKNGFEVRPRKDLKIKPNNNSSDFVMPSFIHGCPVASCAYCLPEGTQISIPGGTVGIEKIQDGDAVIAYDSLTEQLVEARVQGLAQREVEELIELEVDGGSILASPEHPFLTANRGWVKAEALTEDDELVCDETQLKQHHSKLQT